MSASGWIKINEKIQYIKAEENPLSADVFWIREPNMNYLYDVGDSPAALQLIREIPGQIRIILSHFHTDHLGNLKRLWLEQASMKGELKAVCAGDNTWKYLDFLREAETGSENSRALQLQVVKEDIYLGERGNIHIFQLPSSHAKGSVGLEVDGSYLFLGDAMYGTTKKERYGYNVQRLKEELDILQGCEARIFCISHRERIEMKKQVAVAFLQKIYSTREKNSAFIETKMQ